MYIHYQLYGEELKTVETNRVTVLEDGQERFHMPGKVLICGTVPGVDDLSLVVIPFKDIQWFWIEEN